jgi:hypothetical protein
MERRSSLVDSRLDPLPYIQGGSVSETNMHVHQVIVLEDSDIKYQDQFDHMSTALNITHHMTHIYQKRRVSVLKHRKYRISMSWRMSS